MKQTIYYYFCITLLSLAFFTNAQANTLFVENIFTEAVAETPTLAREKAIKQGQNQAFQKLLVQMAGEARAGYYPKLSDSQIANMVKNFQITHEKIEGSTYKARMNIHFNEMHVRKFIAENAAQEIPEQTWPVLVIPVYDKDGTALLWEAENLWSLAWQQASAKNPVVNIHIPLQEIDEIQNITLEAINAGEYGHIMSLANKYGAKDVLIAKASYDPEAAEQLSITLQPLNNSVLFNSFSRIEGTYPQEEQAALKEAAQNIIHAMEYSWRASLAAASPIESNTSKKVIAGIRDLKEWIAVRNKLQGLSIIRSMEVKELSPKKAVMQMEFTTSFEQAQEVIADQGFAVFEEGDIWVIRLQ